ALAVVIGLYSMLFWVFARFYGEREGFVPVDWRFQWLMSVVTLERGLLVSAVLLLCGLGLAVYALGSWGVADFGELSPQRTIRLVIPAGTAILMACEIAFGSFFISVLEIRGSRPRSQAAETSGARAA